ncbi:GntR family transcriptional regulator [Stappia sediminis]|uniref:GntR family transcriptional regulator n=1 Tax=Stappia sediminis TaxID=2692190 RepID=UPI0028B21401|nr:GntR family transcriptional regulator [Stappia sediminis]
MGGASAPRIHRLLSARAVANELRPGARISGSEIAAGCGASRRPVREACIKLAEEGLLEARPQRGTFVREIAVSVVKDARFLELDDRLHAFLDRLSMLRSSIIKPVERHAPNADCRPELFENAGS